MTTKVDRFAWAVSGREIVEVIFKPYLTKMKCRSPCCFENVGCEVCTAERRGPIGTTCTVQPSFSQNEKRSSTSNLQCRPPLYIEKIEQWFIECTIIAFSIVIIIIAVPKYTASTRVLDRHGGSDITRGYHNDSIGGLLGTTLFIFSLFISLFSVNFGQFYNFWAILQCKMNFTKFTNLPYNWIYKATNLHSFIKFYAEIY